MMVSKLVSSYELEDSELNASLCESWQERLSAYDKKENPLLQYCDLFFIFAPFLPREFSPPHAPQKQKTPLRVLSVFGEEHEFNTKCTRSTCFRLFRLLCAHPRLFPFVPCESVNILFT